MSLILFDFDGVLADTLEDLLRFGQQSCDELGVLHTATPNDLSALAVMSFATYGRQLEVPEHLVDEFVRRCLAKFAAKQTPPEIFPGVAEMIRALSANHILGIITGNTSRVVKAFLARHGLEKEIRLILGLDSPGSKVEKIVHARELFFMPAAGVFMVGDATSDIRAAQQAGVKSIAVSWGHQNVQTLLGAMPDMLVDSPVELMQIFQQEAA